MSERDIQTVRQGQRKGRREVEGERERERGRKRKEREKRETETERHTQIERIERAREGVG